MSKESMSKRQLLNGKKLKFVKFKHSLSKY